MRIHAYFKFTNKNVFLNVYKESNAKIVPLLFQTLTLTMKSFSKEEVIIENSQLRYPFSQLIKTFEKRTN